MTFWFQYLAQDAIFDKMLSLFTDAFKSDADIDVILVLGSLKSGLYSPNELTVKLCLQLLNRILEQLRASGDEDESTSSKQQSTHDFDVRFSKWFTKIVIQ